MYEVCKNRKRHGQRTQMVHHDFARPEVRRAEAPGGKHHPRKVGDARLPVLHPLPLPQAPRGRRESGGRQVLQPREPPRRGGQQPAPNRTTASWKPCSAGGKATTATAPSGSTATATATSSPYPTRRWSGSSTPAATAASTSRCGPARKTSRKTPRWYSTPPRSRATRPAS